MADRIIQKLDEIFGLKSDTSKNINFSIENGIGSSDNKTKNFSELSYGEKVVSATGGIHERCPFVITSKDGSKTIYVMEYWNGTSNPDGIRIARKSATDTWSLKSNFSDTYRRLSLPTAAFINGSYIAVATQATLALTNTGNIYVDIVNMSTLSSENRYTIDGSFDNSLRPFLVSDEDYSNPYLYVSYQTTDKVTIKRSTNGGSSWSSLTTFSGYSPGITNTCLAVDKQGLSHIYLAFTANGKLYFSRSTDYGSSWTTPVRINLSGTLQYCSIAASGNKVIIFFQKWYSSTDVDPAYVYSTNSGDNWTSVGSFTTASTYDGLGTVSAMVDGSYFVGAFRKGNQAGNNNSIEYVKIDGNNLSNYEITNNLSVGNISSDDFVSISGYKQDVPPYSQFCSIGYTKLIGGDYDAYYYKALPPPTGVEVLDVNSGRLPIKLTLEQNYPNPFNPSTTIKYGLPQASHVTLNIYNTLGQRVAVLVDQKQEAGYHEASFNASNLGSGVYFYRLQAGNFTSVQKMLLLK